MKLRRGGYLPRIAGRPSGDVARLPVDDTLHISLVRHGIRYAPAVDNGQSIGLGSPLAFGEVGGGKIALPSPANGRVEFDEQDTDSATVHVEDADTPLEILEPFKAIHTKREQMIEACAAAGIWPFFWSDVSKGVPPMDGSETPKSIVVNCVLAEPFRARGRVLLTHAWDEIIEGIRFLPRLIDDYGRVEVVLTDARDSVARKVYRELAGDVWVRIHSVPLKYPIGHPNVLTPSLRRAVSDYSRDDVVWYIDVQGVMALGRRFSRGIPLHERIVAVGGPGCSDPKHLAVRIGTSIRTVTNAVGVDGQTVTLRGGIMQGVPTGGLDEDGVQCDDDSFFCLPDNKDREFLSFLRPGFTRTSYLPAFVSSITRAKDRHISSSLRGERRPCISCGLCENVCPVGLMPQVIHRYLYRDLLDEAEKAGLSVCVDCNLCSFVCPSKVELQKQFAEARAQLVAERTEESVQVNDAD